MNWKSLLEFKDPSETGPIVNAANLLGIGEYQLFELAYADWSGHDPDSKIIDHSFSIYMFEGMAPPYVIRFARHIEEGLRAGTVNREKLGIPPRYPTYPLQRRIGYLALTLLGAIMFFMFAVIYFEVVSGYQAVCFLPPCL